MKNRKENSGITLVALVVTIVVLLILAGITIQLLMTDNGIIGKAEQAKIAQEVAELKDRIYLNIIDWEADKIVTTETTIDHLWDKLIQDKIISKDDVEKSADEENVYFITTTKDYLVEIIVNDNGNVTIGDVVKGDELPPKIKQIEVTSKTTNNIEVAVTVDRLKEGKLTYLYKKDSEPDTSYKELKKDTTDLTANFTGLEQNVVYNIKVVASNKNGTKEAVISELTGEIANGTITQKGTTIWNNGLASIELETTETSYTMQYKINGGTWIEYNGAITGLKHNDVVYARLTDGTNISDEATVNIQDGIAPNVTVTKGTVNTNTIQVSASATDNESGMPSTPEYNYYVKKTADANYQATPNYTGSNTSYTFTNLIQNTSYEIKVTTKDKANNEGTKTLSNITTGTIGGATGGLISGNIIASNPTWSNGSANIALSTTTGLTIQYKVNSGNWTNGTSISGLKHNDVVFARLTDGVNYGDDASINIQDGIAPQTATISLSSQTTVEGKAITATVTNRDNESGAQITNCKWVYNTTAGTIGINASSYSNTFSSNPQTISLNTSTVGTYYLHVLTTDTAGNKKETISSAITVKEPTISDLTEIQTENKKVKDDKGNTITVPKGFKVVTSEGITVQQGIVIEDKDQNQFVWIPVGEVTKDDGSKTTIQLGRYTFDESNGTPILVQAAYTEANPTNYTQEVTIGNYKELSTYRAGVASSGTDGLNATAKNLAGFVNSTKTNGGYYLARYEASYGSGSSIADYKPLSKVSTATSFNNLTVGSLWNNITQLDASKVSQNMYTTSDNVGVESDLTNSYAWDTAIVYIQEMGNSNYANKNRGTNTTLKNTGETGDKVCNIYDMAANTVEWTTEYSTFVYSSNAYPYPCTGRSVDCSNSYCFAANRGGDIATKSGRYISFRLTLYVK